jgi:hypothetical protein
MTKTINKNFTTKPDDPLQNVLFGQVKEMEMRVFEIKKYLINNNKIYNGKYVFFHS